MVLDGVGSLSALRRAAWLALLADAEMVAATAADPAAALVLLETARQFEDVSGRIVGVKIGGIDTADAALAFVALVADQLGDPWLTPTRFRLGSATALPELLTRQAGQDRIAE